MTNPRGLMGIGMPAQQAKRLGLDPTSTTAAGTTQATAQAIGQFNFYVRGLGTSSNYGFTLSSVAELGSEYLVVAVTATVVVWPPVGGQMLISGGLTATGISLAIGKSAAFLTVTATTFDAFLSG